MSGEKDQLVYDIEKMAAIMEGRELSDRENKPNYKADFFNMYKMMRDSKAREELSNPRQLAFLSAYSILGNVTQAAKCTGISPGSVYNWKGDEVFDKYYELADRAHMHYLQSEAQRRAVEGVQEPVYYQGQKIGEKTKYSDNLLMFLMKGKEPEKYRDNARVEVTGDGGGPIQIEFTPPDMDREIEVINEEDIIEG